MLSVHYNPSVLYAQNYLARASNSVASALEKMSTGFRINRASDDAAGLYVATKMNSQLRGLKQAQNNISNGLSILNMADSALGDITDLLQRVRDLAVQGANSVYSDASRRAMQAEADALIEEVFRVKDSTLFNGMNVFSGGSGVSTISNLSRASWRVNSENTLAEDVSAVSTPQNSETGSVSVFSGDSSVSTASVSRLTEEEAISQGYTLIKTAQDLDNIRNNLSGKYILMNDIDLSSYSNWDPIGEVSDDLSTVISSFNGTLDGNGYSIKNLSAQDKEYFSLFAAIDGAEIKNLEMDNFNFRLINLEGAMSSPIALIANNSTISNCTTSGNILGTYSATNGHYLVGAAGLISGAENSNIEYCSSSVNISGGYLAIGGLLGSAQNCDITKSSYSGTIDASATGAGTIGAGVDVNISDCYVSGEIAVGEAYGIAYSLDGNNSINNCFVNTNIILSLPSGASGGLIAGIAGSNTGNLTVNNVFWNTDKTAAGTQDFGHQNGTLTGQISGLTTSEMQDPANWAGWDTDIWDFSTYPPKLKWETDRTNDTNNGIRLQVGANADPTGNAIYIDTAFDLDAFSVDFSDSATSAASIITIDNLLDTISTRRAGFGAAMNRLEAVMQANTSSIENLTASKSTIMDADIAEQSAEYVKNQILQQTTSALLSQAQSFQGSIILGLLS